MYQHILVPVDGSPCSDRAVEHATTLARRLGAEVVFLYVMDTLRSFNEGVMPDVRRELELQGHGILERALKFAAEVGVRASRQLAEGSPAEIILYRAPEHDVVVMGTHGRGFWQRLAMGSVTEAVVRKSPRPVLVIPPPREEPAPLL